jgi:hypothetical protein
MIDVQAILDKRTQARVTKALQGLEMKTRKKFLREETRRANKQHILPLAKIMVPEDEGRLAKAIKVVAIKRSRRFVGTKTAQTGKGFEGEMFYGGFQEWGWRPRNKAMKDQGQLGVTKVEGKEFMRDAVLRGGAKAQRAALNAIWKRIKAHWNNS